MRVTNIRHGFATNSSSSHSIVFLNEGETFADDLGELDGEAHFGWGNFTLATPDSKKLYTAVILDNALGKVMPSDLAGALTKHISGVDVPAGSYIDHQSALELPLVHPGMHSNMRFPNVDFWRDLNTAICATGVAILGGNDNSDYHPLDDGRSETAWAERLRSFVGEIAVKHNNYWALFNPKTGHKIRMTFDDSLPTKAIAPELVDLKITDYCGVPNSLTCRNCYQNSGRSGAHADKYEVEYVIHHLAVHGCFEIALGGGEPTAHPDLIYIARQARSAGVVPNMTTRSLDWCKSATKADLDLFGGIAFSVETAAEAAALIATFPDDDDSHTTWGHRYHQNKFSFQAVVGMTTPEEYKAILDLCQAQGMRLTLLGYKPVGRASATPIPLDWLRIFTEKRDEWVYPRMSLGVDTVLAATNRAGLAAAEVDERCYEVEEGKFSCYVDAVKRTIAPSSFSADVRPLEPYCQNLIPVFQGF